MKLLAIPLTGAVFLRKPRCLVSKKQLGIGMLDSDDMVKLTLVDFFWERRFMWQQGGFLGGFWRCITETQG